MNRVIKALLKKGRALVSIFLLLLLTQGAVEEAWSAEEVRPGENLVDIQYSKEDTSVQIRAKADGAIPSYRSLEMTDPSRLVVDFPGMKSRYPKNKVMVNHLLLETVRIGVSEDKVRLVLDIPQKEIPSYEITKQGDTLIILLGKPSGKEAVEEPPPAGPQAPLPLKEEVKIPPEPPKKTPDKEAISPEKEIKPPFPAGEEKKLTGVEVARRVYERDDGKDSQTTVDMRLIDSRGNERRRTMIVQVKESGNLNKTLIRFTEPADIEGTGLLIMEKESEDNEQFLYLPELRRVRRIVSGKKDGKFVNTEFTYEDLERRKVEKDDHRLLREETVEEKECYVLESIPKKGMGSQYSKLIAWILKDSYLPVKTEYCRKGEKVEKVFEAKRVEQVDGIWTVMQSEIVDLKDNRRTIMIVKEVKYNTGMADDLFTERNLQHY